MQNGLTWVISRNKELKEPLLKIQEGDYAKQ
jgi:hypothetical protein